MSNRAVVLFTYDVLTTSTSQPKNLVIHLLNRVHISKNYPLLEEI
jgi:hypothetical protein